MNRMKLLRQAAAGYRLMPDEVVSTFEISFDQPVAYVTGWIYYIDEPRNQGGME